MLVLLRYSFKRPRNASADMTIASFHPYILFIPILEVIGLLYFIKPDRTEIQELITLFP